MPFKSLQLKHTLTAELEIPREQQHYAASPTDTSNAQLPLPPPGQDPAPPAGPALGPSMPTEDADEQPEEDLSTPQSPYTSTSEAIRNLTMPPVPNFNIPPSPPGSPPPASTKKFARFLELKKQGVHFNERLEQTTALKNPGLFQKLKEHAGINEEEQYASSLSEDLAVPTSFPPWAYGEELNKSQQKIKHWRELADKGKRREAIDFVPASGSAASSRGATPGGKRKR